MRHEIILFGLFFVSQLCLFLWMLSMKKKFEEYKRQSNLLNTNLESMVRETCINIKNSVDSYSSTCIQEMERYAKAGLEKILADFPSLVNKVLDQKDPDIQKIITQRMTSNIIQRMVDHMSHINLELVSCKNYFDSIWHKDLPSERTIEEKEIEEELRKKIGDEAEVLATEFGTMTVRRKVNAVPITLWLEHHFTSRLKEEWASFYNNMEFINLNVNATLRGIGLPIPENVKVNRYVRICCVVQFCDIRGNSIRLKIADPKESLWTQPFTCENLDMPREMFDDIVSRYVFIEGIAHGEGKFEVKKIQQTKWPKKGENPLA